MRLSELVRRCENGQNRMISARHALMVVREVIGTCANIAEMYADGEENDVGAVLTSPQALRARKLTALAIAAKLREYGEVAE